MKKQIAVVPVAILALFVIAGCQEPESKGSVSNIRVFLNGVETTAGLTIEQEQTVTLTARVGVDPDFVSIAWENEGGAVEIISSGSGPECTVKGREVDIAGITVKAWRTGEKMVVQKVPVTVKPAEVTGISIAGGSRIIEGETQALAAEITPAWARFPLNWTAAPAGYVDLEEDDNGNWTIKGL